MTTVATGTARANGRHRLTAAVRIALVLAFIFSAAAMPLAFPAPVDASHTVYSSTFDTDPEPAVLMPGTWNSSTLRMDVGSSDRASQTFAIPAGATVDVTVTCQRTAAGGSVYLQVNSSPESTGTGASSTQHTSECSYSSAVTRTVTHTAPSTYDWVWFALTNTSASMVDNVTITVTSTHDGTGGPTPTPVPSGTPEPTAEPTPAPTESPGFEEPAYGTGGARWAAIDDEYNTWMASRCASGMSLGTKHKDELGNVVVSCQSWGDDIEQVEQKSENGQNGVTLASTWFAGEVRGADVIHVAGNTRPLHGADQTWCAPSDANSDCETNDDSLGSHRNLTGPWGTVPSLYEDANLSDWRTRARVGMTAFVMNNEGKIVAEDICNAWPVHANKTILRGGIEFHARDGWLCDLPEASDGFLFFRARVFGEQGRQDSPYPNPDLTDQRYGWWVGYSVLYQGGRFVDRQDGEGWLVCTDDDWTEGPIYPCMPDIPGWVEPDTTELPKTPDGSQVDGEPEPAYPDGYQNPGDTACPVTGEAKPGCIPMPSCVAPDGVEPWEWTAHVACTVSGVPIFLLNVLVDLFMPGEAMARALDTLGDLFSERAPFGWFMDLWDGINAALTADPSQIAIAELCIAGACIGVSPYDFTAGVQPYRGLIFAGVAFVLLIGCLHTIMGAVGHARTPKQLDMGL